MNGRQELRSIKEGISIEAFMRQRYGVEFNARGWAKCPFPERHNNGDAKPSLHIHKQRATCHSQQCFQGDDVFGVVMKADEVGLAEAKRIVTGNSVTPPIPQRQPERREKSPVAATVPAQEVSSTLSPKRTEAARFEYVYLDATGEDTLMVRRIEYDDGSKAFAQFVPHSGNGWKPGGIRGGDTPLYRLPELRDGDDPIVVVEGEKKCDALRGLGYTVTTCAGGAGKFTKAHAACLKGRDVVVWGDNDTPGQEHAEKVCDQLIGSAGSVRCVRPPEDLRAKGDVLDMLEERREDEVRSLIETATAYRPPKGAKVVVQLSQVKAEKPTWLWYPRIPAGYLTLLFGDGGVGKTHIGLAIAAALSKGAGLPGAEGTGHPSPSIYFTGEDQLSELRRRLDEMDADTQHIYAYAEPFGLDEEGIQFVESMIVEKKAELAIIDPVVAFLGRDVDFYRANETRSILAPLSEAAERTRAAILLSTHVTKGQTAKAVHRALGSGDFVNAARSALLAGSDTDDPDRCGLFHEKANLGPKAPPLGYTIKDGRFAWTGETTLTTSQVLGGGDTADLSARDEAEQFLREVLANGRMPAKDVMAEAGAAGITQRTLRRAKERVCKIQKSAFDDGWTWELKPEDGHEGAQDGHI
jgi:putative DNA primase/helicase